ncbi:RNA pseudouridine synthase [bacterium]|nr:RNA pseudouridine synthase [bacterium]
MHYELIEINKEYLVINKPAGLLVHGAPHIDDKTLADDLIKRFPEIIKVGDDPFRPGIVHRLDKLASGLMVIARTNESFTGIKAQFMNREIKKTYTALVFGQTSKDEDEILFPIKRSSKGHRMAALPATEKGEKTTEGRKAISKFKVTKKYINYTLLEIRIKTGRTHQIRVHMSAYGHPLVGDDLYGTKKTKIKNKKINLGRFFLVASRLEFRDLAGKTQKYKISLPEDLKKFLTTIKEIK